MMMDTLEAVRQKVNKLEASINKLHASVNMLKVSDTKIETEFKYIKILLMLSLGANTWIGVKLGLPIN